MKLHYTDEQRAVQDMLRGFLDKEYSSGTRADIVASPDGYSTRVWKMFGELGVIGALFGESDGGFGGSGSDIAVVFENLGRALVVEPVLSSAVLAGGALTLGAGGGHEELRAELAAGTGTAAWAHSEAESGYEPTWVTTSATRDGAGWILDGSKIDVAYAGAASTLVVSARTSGEAADRDGLTLFAVPNPAPGLTVRRYPTVDGGRIAEVVLDRVAVPDTAVIGTVDGAGDVIDATLDRGVLALCAEAVGAMRVALEQTVEYLCSRKQFGVPLGSMQALQHRLVDLWARIEQADAAVVNAVAALDGADRHTRGRALSAAKYTIGTTGTAVAEECIQLHGAIGMTDELALSHYAKRLIGIDHQLGDSDFHLQRYIDLGKEKAS